VQNKQQDTDTESCDRSNRSSSKKPENLGGDGYMMYRYHNAKQTTEGIKPILTNKID